MFDSFKTTRKPTIQSDILFSPFPVLPDSTIRILRADLRNGRRIPCNTFCQFLLYSYNHGWYFGIFNHNVLTLPRKRRLNPLFPYEPTMMNHISPVQTQNNPVPGFLFQMRMTAIPLSAQYFFASSRIFFPSFSSRLYNSGYPSDRPIPGIQCRRDSLHHVYNMHPCIHQLCRSTVSISAWWLTVDPSNATSMFVNTGNSSENHSCYEINYLAL